MVVQFLPFQLNLPMYSVCRDPLTVNDLGLGGTNMSCLAEFGGPVMPWVALGGFSGNTFHFLNLSSVHMIPALGYND
jgi:hypothetical protein